MASLIDAIETWAEHWNDDPKPFTWHADADRIIEKVRRGRATLTRIKSPTDDSALCDALSSLGQDGRSQRR